MERLTERTAAGVANINYSGCYFDDGMRDKIAESARRQTVIERLASIEDILGEDYDLDRLRELVEAVRDGRCVVLLESGYSYIVGDIELNSVMYVALFYNDPVTRYITEAVVEKRNRQYAEAALEG